MTIAPGTRIGPYEVIEPLGAGGMGQVFRARDARLKRDVALKVLSIAAGDPIEYRARFEREAQVLASLNHPRIAQVFSVEEIDGVPVIAMELVEGPTLAERIARRPLALDESLAIATQIADGLEAAHDRGIVHRDLKPANIKIRPDGSVTILDFGLARALEPNGGADLANSPTMLGGDTAVGVIMGTAAYMSPEQARGRAVDKRADIWAFGCVLFELLSGTQAFAGESTTDVLAAVVQNDPDWSKLPRSVPPRIGDLLRRCLQKNPKDRLRDIGDARYEIAHATRPMEHADTPRQALPTRSSFAPLAWLAALAAVVVAGALILTTMRRGDVAPDAPVRSTIMLPPNTTLVLSRGSALALSPDGRRLVYAGRAAGKTQLFVRALDRFDSQAIPGTDDAQSPFFSSDGRWVGFFAGDKLKKVAIDGGAPVALADARAPRGEAWGDGDAIFVTPANTDPVMRLSALGGKLVPVTKLEAGEMSHRWPHVLPGGRGLLFAIWNDNGWEPSRIAAQRADASSHTVIVEAGGGYPHYIRDGASGRGFLVYARSEGLLAASFNESTLTLAGQPVPVVDNVITNLSGGAHFDLSPTGTLAYVAGTAAENERELAWVTMDGTAVPMPRVRITGRLFQLSGDGTRIALSRQSSSTASPGIWIEDLVRGVSRRLTESADDFTPVWSPDGSFVVYTRGVRSSALYRRPAGGGPEEVIVSGAQLLRSEAVSPDGRTVLYQVFDPVTGADIWSAPVGGPASGAPHSFVTTKFTETNPVFSPDGRWVSYQSNESGRFEAYARSFPDAARTVQLTTGGALAPQWAPDGRTLYYYGSNGKMMAVPLEMTATDIRTGKPATLFDCSAYETQFAVAPDGKRFLMMPLIKAETAGTQVQLVTNFLSELKQRVR